MNISYLESMSSIRTNSLRLQRQPKDLVCERCWNEVFTSDVFATACWGEPNSVGGGFRYDVSVGELLESADSGCNWCRLVLHVADENGVELTGLSKSTTIPISFFDQQWGDGDVKNGFNLFTLGLMGQHQDSLQYQDLFAWADPNNIAFRFVKARKVEPKVDTEEAFEVAKTWIRDCEFHENCFEQEETDLPTRVIDVSPDENPDQPRLLAGNFRGRYATLSYCWGQRQIGVTTSANLQSRLNFIDLRELSKSVRDAIHCTKQLGLKYLWVDAICIIQDSEDDRNLELANMRNIYQRSHITLVAANAMSAHDGFLSDRPESQSFEVPFPCPSKDFGIFSLGKGRYFPEDEPIHRRGWTLQEYLMSPRLLIYAKYTFHYKCHTIVTGLGDSRYSAVARLPPYFFQPRRQKLALSSERLLDVLRNWALIVNEFTKRHLSDDGDRLNAVAGIAEVFSNLLRARYLCGLWETHLLQQLLWTVHFPQELQAAEYSAPSWSWASVKGSVEYQLDLLFTPDRCELLECQFLPQSASLPFGGAASGSLRLRGAMCKAWYQHPRELLTGQLGEDAASANKPFRRDDANSGSNEYMSYDPRAFLDTWPEDGSNFGWVYCLIIGKRFAESERLGEYGRTSHTEGLILLPISLASMTFRRIGAFSGRMHFGLGADWLCEVVTII